MNKDITTNNQPSESCEKNPVLLIMAAGIGSRYGGNKQLDSMTESGEIIMDFSLYDAYMAGFREAVIIIRKEMEEEIRKHLENGAMKRLNISFAYQDKEDLLGLRAEDIAEGETLKKIEARTKPWGTGHAVLSSRNLISGPFAVINADDFYGRDAFSSMFQFLKSTSPYLYAMVAYRLDMTLSKTGHVSRGVCTIGEGALLKDITERTMIKKLPSEEIGFSEDEGLTWTSLPSDTPVSMNFWGFSGEMMDELASGFPEALKNILASNPEKGEYYLPGAVDKLLKEGKADVTVLNSKDKWYGVTNREDREEVVAALKNLKDAGLYPRTLWD